MLRIALTLVLAGCSEHPTGSCANCPDGGDLAVTVDDLAVPTQDLAGADFAGADFAIAPDLRMVMDLSGVDFYGVDLTFVACGAIGERCCNGACTAGTGCFNGMCVQCGDPGLNCCPDEG